MNTTMISAVTTVGQHWNGGPPDGGPPFFVLPFAWLLLVGAVLATIFLARRRREREGGRRAGEHALAEAYATGRIDDQTYRARRAVLREKA